MDLWSVSIRQWARRIPRYLSLIAALGFFSAPNARAQQPEIKDLAAKMAQSLHSAGQKKVAVFDFVGPGQSITALGTKLADDFSRALSQSDGHLHVEDRNDVAHRMKEMDYGPEDSLNSESVLTFATLFKVDAAVLGMIERDGDQVRILVRALQIGRKGATVIDSRSATMAVSDESAKLMQTYIAGPESNADVDKSFPVAGKGGYSFPGCLYCPQPQYSHAALDAKLQGTVMVIAVVTADGRATNIKAIKPLAYGLTDNAIQAIEQWKFEPAKDPDGRPIAVRQIIEVTFHIYR